MRGFIGILLACATVAVAPDVFAQDETYKDVGVARAFTDLSLRLAPGDVVTVVDAQGKAVSGPVRAVSPNHLELSVSGRPVTFTEQTVSLLQQRRYDSVGNGAMIGLLGGALFFGVLAANASEGGGVGCSGVAVAAQFGILTAASAGVGALVDAAIASQRTIYIRRTVASGLVVEPVIGRAVVGAQVRLGF